MNPKQPRMLGSAVLGLLAACLLLFATTASSEAPGDGPTIGVAVQDVPFPRLERLGLDHGVRVHRVMPGSPAEDAGIQANDVVIALDGSPVYSVQRLQWMVARQPAGEPVTLTLYRGGEENGKRMDINVVPTAAPPEAAAEEPPVVGGMAWLGIRMQPLTNALRGNYGVPPGRGILVADVEADSPASKADLLAGDVLLRIDRKVIRSPRDVYRALNFFDPGERVEIEVMRDGERKTLEVTLGRAKAGGPMPYPHPHYYPGHPRQGFWPEPPEFWPENMEDFLEQWRLPPPQLPEGMQGPSAKPHTGVSL